jgi:putative transposase
MITARPSRLKNFDYLGCHRYFLTFCTALRHSAFINPRVVSTVQQQLIQRAAEDRFALSAYCFMPDHLHILVAGLRADSALLSFVARFRQASGYWYSKAMERDLWQKGYFEYVLREADATDEVAKYILANPVRSGLTTAIGEYPYAALDTFGVAGVTWDPKGPAKAGRYVRRPG